MIRTFLRDDRGATSIEYALIAAAIGLVIVVALGAIGDALDGTFNDVATGLD